MLQLGISVGSSIIEWSQLILLPAASASLISCPKLQWTLEDSKFHPGPCLSTETVKYEVWKIKVILINCENLENIKCSLSRVFNWMGISTTVIEDRPWIRIRIWVFLFCLYIPLSHLAWPPRCCQVSQWWRWPPPCQSHHCCPRRTNGRKTSTYLSLWWNH